MDYMPTKFWVKQSGSVAFRRAMVNNEIPGSVNFSPGKTYKIMMQYGLFNDDQDEDPKKVNGTVKFEDAFEFTTQSQVTPYSGAHALQVAGLALAMCLSVFI